MSRFFPAEWAPQRFVQLTWPHKDTDWADMLDEVSDCFRNIASAITRFEHLLIVAPDIEAVRNYISGRVDMSRVVFAQLPSNDTWARDHGGITVFEDEERIILDFCFNGWGLKFPADKDNLITYRLHNAGILNDKLLNCRNFVFEGGSIESDGHGTLLTTTECLLSPNRNPTKSKDEIDIYLRDTFGVWQVLWLDHGFLQGDDTDSHIDTLARLCPNDTIVYVKSTNPNDIHHEALSRMEQQLKTFRTLTGKPYQLVPLPMAEPVYDDGERLPATYANYLVINGAVLVPTYNTALDAVAIDTLKTVFPDRQIIGIDCRSLIRQHGSLHCVTMQYPQ